MPTTGFLAGQAVADRATREALDLLFQGKSNNVTTVTLAAGSATTTLADARLGPGSFIGLMPTTANAAAALGGLYVSARGKQTATLTHANNGTTDRTFVVLIVG